MDIDEFVAELEADLQWRETEIQLHMKQLIRAPASDHDVLRKSLVLMLYAHVEGFAKFGLTHYISAINKANLQIADVSYCIAAAALTNLFKELRNPDQKSEYFRGLLPDDTALHRFARDRGFLEGYNKYIAKKSLSLSDSVVDLESNLKVEVLLKNLYKLGLPYRDTKNFKSELTTLLNFRNQIAHGSFRGGIDQGRYKLCKDGFDKVNKFMKSTLTEAFKDRAYLLTNSYY